MAGRDRAVALTERDAVRLSNELNESHWLLIENLRRKTRFSETTIQDLSRTFSRLSESGTPAEFDSSAFADALIELKLLYVPSDVVFRVLDCEGDGAVSGWKIMAGMGALCKGSVREKIESILEARGWLQRSKNTDTFVAAPPSISLPEVEQLLLLSLRMIFLLLGALHTFYENETPENFVIYVEFFNFLREHDVKTVAKQLFASLNSDERGLVAGPPLLARMLEDPIVHRGFLERTKDSSSSTTAKSGGRSPVAQKSSSPSRSKCIAIDPKGLFPVVIQWHWSARKVEISVKKAEEREWESDELAPASRNRSMQATLRLSSGLFHSKFIVSDDTGTDSECLCVGADNVPLLVGPGALHNGFKIESSIEELPDTFGEPAANLGGEAPDGKPTNENKRDPLIALSTTKTVPLWVTFEGETAFKEIICKYQKRGETAWGCQNLRASAATRRPSVAGRSTTPPPPSEYASSRATSPLTAQPKRQGTSGMRESQSGTIALPSHLMSSSGDGSVRRSSTTSTRPPLPRTSRGGKLAESTCFTGSFALSPGEYAFLFNCDGVDYLDPATKLEPSSVKRYVLMKISAALTPLRPSIAHAGFVKKQSATLKSWKKKWVRLQYVSLLVYRDSADKDPRKELSLERWEAFPEYPKKNCFAVMHNGKTSVFQVDSETELEEWLVPMRAARSVCQRERYVFG